MASSSDRPDLQAFEELQQLVRHLGDELASFRRRALQAEARVKSFESAPGGARVSAERLERMETENADLKKRLESARSRTRQLLDRVRFLRQQHEGATR